MEKHSLVRTIYLYLFALLGLALLTIGGVRFLDMGLKAFVFTKAEEEQRLIYQQPPILPVIQIEKIENAKEEKEVCLSGVEKTTLERWMADYNNWKERKSKIDYVTTRRHRDASGNLSLILIGLPLYLFHWRIIRRETKDKETKDKEK